MDATTSATNPPEIHTNVGDIPPSFRTKGCGGGFSPSLCAAFHFRPKSALPVIAQTPMRDAISNMNGTNGVMYRRKRTSNDSRNRNVGTTHARTSRSARRRPPYMAIATVNGIANHARIPRGRPSPQTEVCWTWYRNGGVPTY